MINELVVAAVTISVVFLVCAYHLHRLQLLQLQLDRLTTDMTKMWSRIFEVEQNYTDMHRKVKPLEKVDEFILGMDKRMHSYEELSKRLSVLEERSKKKNGKKEVVEDIVVDPSEIL